MKGLHVFTLVVVACVCVYVCMGVGLGVGVGVSTSYQLNQFWGMLARYIDR